MAIKAPYYPIVYVRGFAATMAEIEETVATPYMGFNLGSTKIRQNSENEIVRFIFESPLLRLMKDEGYRDTYQNGDLVEIGQAVDAKSIWVFRYYEEVSKDLGTGNRKTILEFAVELRKFILQIRDHICGNDKEERKNFKVYLVAHSMGGLLTRCYLQNICRHYQNELLELPGPSLVDKVFTYATPHNGIDIFGFNALDMGPLDPFHVKNFNRDYMRDYLRISDERTPVSSLDGAFPEEHFFCFVGTNYRDYGAFYKLSKKGTGPMSDGLVMMKNAVVSRAPRAFAHRSHSGPYGIVNSEEGYQNLRRFLFGQVRVDLRLSVDEIMLPPNVQEQRDAGKDVEANYNIDVTAKVRGAGYFLNERRVIQESAIRKPLEEMAHQDESTYLFSGYLHKAGKSQDSQDTALGFSIHISIEVPAYQVDNRFWFDDYYEGERLFSETITFEVRTTMDKTTVRYGLSSQAGVGKANRMGDLTQADSRGRRFLQIPIGFRKGVNNPPRPGFRGKLLLTASPWNK